MKKMHFQHQTCRKLKPINWVDFLKGTYHKKLGLKDEIMVSDLAVKNEDFAMKVDSLVMALKSLLFIS